MRKISLWGIIGKPECNQHITPVYPRTLYNLSMSLLLYKNSYVWFRRVEVSTNASDLMHGMMIVFLQWCTPHRRTCVVMFVQGYATDLIDKEPCLILIDSDRSCLPFTPDYLQAYSILHPRTMWSQTWTWNTVCPWS